MRKCESILTDLSFSFAPEKLAINVKKVLLLYVVNISILKTKLSISCPVILQCITLLYVGLPALVGLYGVLY